MSTASLICREREDGYYECIYCYWDGNLEHNGRILQEYYNDVKKVNELFSQGSMSFLGSKIEPDEDRPHTFDEPQNDVCIFYHRDRGELWDRCKPCVLHPSELPGPNSRIHYVYVFTDNRWHYRVGKENVEL